MLEKSINIQVDDLIAKIAELEARIAALEAK